MQPITKYDRQVFVCSEFPVGTRWYFRDGAVLKQVHYKALGGEIYPGFVMLKQGAKTTFKEWCGGYGRWSSRWSFYHDVDELTKIELPDKTVIIV